jgi:hypothetical protein
MLLFLSNLFQCYPAIYAQDLKVHSSLQVFQLKRFMHFSHLPHILPCPAHIVPLDLQNISQDLEEAI